MVVSTVVGPPGGNDNRPPKIKVDQAKNSISRGSTNTLTAEVDDNKGLSTVYLLTNETGRLERKNVYGSPKKPFQKKTTVSFDWSNFSVKDSYISWQLFANDTSGNTKTSNSLGFEVFSNPDFSLNSLSLQNESSIDEGDKVDIEANISNEGTASSDINVSLIVETDSGSGYSTYEKRYKKLNLDINESKVANFNWEAETGPFRFTVKPVSGSYSFESDKPVTVNIPSHQTYYGNSTVEVSLTSEGNKFHYLRSDSPEGRIYFSDYDSNYLFSDLKSLDTFSDIGLADEDLDLEGHNDSLQELFDRNEDGIIDNFQEIEVGQRNLSVPVTDSTSSSSFKTGILYNSENGNDYDGSQDLIFVTPFRSDSEGKYGVYDYETKIPSSLKSQTGDSDKISIYTELE
jgi:hypothetical protein